MTEAEIRETRKAVEAAAFPLTAYALVWLMAHPSKKPRTAFGRPDASYERDKVWGHGPKAVKR